MTNEEKVEELLKERFTAMSRKSWEKKVREHGEDGARELMRKLVMVRWDKRKKLKKNKNA